MGFKDDSDGQIFSLDLLIALIPLALVLGFVAADMDNILYLVQDTVYRGSNERVAFDTVNALLQTSGDPVNWETNGTVNVVGLAKYDTAKNMAVEGTISPGKLAELSNDHIQNMIGPEYGFYLNVTRINPDGSNGATIKTLGTYNSSANDIVRVEKRVLASKYESVSSLMGEIRYTGQTRTYTAPKFQTSYFYNQTYNYWILILDNNGFNSAVVNINGNSINLNSSTINNSTLINSSYIYTNSTNPTQFFNNTVTLNATGSFGSSMNFFIVQAPKDASASDINKDNVNPAYSKFIFYLWVK